VLAVNWTEPVAIPEDPVSELEDVSGGGAASAGGAEELVVVVACAESVELVVVVACAESVELVVVVVCAESVVVVVELSGGANVLVEVVSDEPVVSPDEVGSQDGSVGSQDEVVSQDGSAGSQDESAAPVSPRDVELVMVVQLEEDVKLERSVLFMPIRLVMLLAGSRHVVVVTLALLVMFEIDDVSVRLAESAPEVMFEVDDVSVRLAELAPEVMFEAVAVEFEASARHAGGGVGMSEEPRLTPLTGPAVDAVASASNEISP
jgi:hypothetical protein